MASVSLGNGCRKLSILSGVIFWNKFFQNLRVFSYGIGAEILDFDKEYRYPLRFPRDLFGRRKAVF